MENKKYMLLMPNEDGNPVCWVDEDEVKDIIQLKEDYGIEEFLEDFPTAYGSQSNPPTPETDPQMWGEGQAMLLEVEIKKVVPVKVVEQYEVK